LILGTGLIDGGIAIDKGRIIAIGLEGNLPDAKNVIDAENAYILPGLMDPHVHFRDPGLVDREDFLTGSTAAAAGGMTTVFDMPNTVPPTSDPARLLEKRRIAEAKARVDFGLFGIVGQQNVDQIEALASAGVIGFKLYLHQTMEGIDPCDDGALLEAFERIAATGLRAAVHAENPEIIHRKTEALKAKGRNEAGANLDARPDVSESEMVERCIAYARFAGANLHVCHVTSKQTVDLIREAKLKKDPITAETGPQWLWFTQEDVVEKGTVLMFSPPFRQGADRSALWEALHDGTIDMIASDHAPRHDDEKLCSSVWNAKSGFVGVETSAPLMLTAVQQGKISMEQYANLASEGPARTYGLWPTKGSLMPGSDADITIARLGDSKLISRTQLHSRAALTPFLGASVSGTITHTIVRGHLAWQAGRPGTTPIGHDVALERSSVSR
jgi:dihydroorotase